MFGLSWMETLVIVVLGLCLIGPKELPVVIRSVRRFADKLRHLKNEVMASFNDIADQEGMKDVHEALTDSTKLIVGDDGKTYQAFDISDLETHKSN